MQTDGAFVMTDCATAIENQNLYQRAIRFFIYGQLGFLLFLLVCIILQPRGLLANHGFSYYGDYARTTLPYRLAFLAVGILSYVSSLFFPPAMPFRAIRFAFRLMLPLLLGIVVTTAPARPDLDRIHVPLGVVLFVLQVSLSFWLALYVCKDRRNYALLALLTVGGVLSLLALLKVIPYLIEGQMLFQLAFALLTIHSLNQLKSRL